LLCHRTAVVLIYLICRWLKLWHGRSRAALVTVLLTMFLLFSLGGLVMYHSITDFIKHVNGYEHEIIRIGNEVGDLIKTSDKSLVVIAFPVIAETDSAEQCDIFGAL
jgi:predicted PurR-regulated permease PerM